MAILINRNTRVITQGITGKTGQFHTRACAAYANGKQLLRRRRYAWQGRTGASRAFPIYDTVAQAKAATGATVSVIYVPPPYAAAAIDEAVDAGIDLVICITEGIPVRDMIRTRYRMRDTKTILVGPNCPGVITPDEIKIGIMPGHIHSQGPVGVVSRSGTLTYEAVGQLMEQGWASPAAWGSAATRSTGSSTSTCMQMFNEDPQTEAVVMVGEIGGSDEEECARWIKDNMTQAGGRLHRRRHRAAGQAHGTRRRDHLGRQGHRGRKARGDGGVRDHDHAQSRPRSASLRARC